MSWKAAESRVSRSLIGLRRHLGFDGSGSLPGIGSETEGLPSTFLLLKVLKRRINLLG